MKRKSEGKPTFQEQKRECWYDTALAPGLQAFRCKLCELWLRATMNRRPLMKSRRAREVVFAKAELLREWIASALQFKGGIFSFSIRVLRCRLLFAGFTYGLRTVFRNYRWHWIDRDFYLPSSSSLDFLSPIFCCWILW